MNRAQALIDHVTARRLLDAAIERFHSHGYERATVRDIAAAAGLGGAGLYSHFPSKLALLNEIAESTYAAAVAQTQAAISAAGLNPAARLDAAIWAQCEFAIDRRHAIGVVEADFSNLDAEVRERVTEAKRSLAEMLGEIIDAGTLLGVFAVEDPVATGRELATMCASISSWFEPTSSDCPRQIAETYCELGSRMAGARPGGRRARPPATVPQRQTPRLSRAISIR